MVLVSFSYCGCKRSFDKVLYSYAKRYKAEEECNGSRHRADERESLGTVLNDL